MMKLKKDSSHSNIANSIIQERRSSSKEDKKPDISKEEFEFIKVLSVGSFSKILLVKKEEKMVLKGILTEFSTYEEFHREMNYNYFLSPHPNIVTSYDVSFVWDSCFLYVQEYAPFGDLARFVKKGGLTEDEVKAIARQLSSAIEFIHSVNLVHGALSVENILVFKSNFSIIKICDFGHTRRTGTLVTKTNERTADPYAPPELCEIILHEKYYMDPSTDVWNFGVVLVYLLTGNLPWNFADITDPPYARFSDWQKRRSVKMPQRFVTLSTRALRLFKRLFEPKASKRCKVKEVTKYLNDEWIKKEDPAGVRKLSSDSSKFHRASTNRHSQNHKTLQRSKSDYQLSSRKLRPTRSFPLEGVESELSQKLVLERVSKWITDIESKDE